MLKKRTPSDFTDYLAILKRRAWWIAIPLVIVPLAVFIASFYVPKMYRSQTMILVEPQVIPSDYIHPTVSSDITQRLQTLIQEILSRTRLEKIIDQFGLYRNSP